MSWPHGKASVDPSSMDAWGVCDRCGQWRNHGDLAWQYEWRGKSLTNIKLLVCSDRCLDVPQQQLRVLTLPPDPVPIKNPRTPFSELQMLSAIQDEFGAALYDQLGNQILQNQNANVD